MRILACHVLRAFNNDFGNMKNICYTMFIISLLSLQTVKASQKEDYLDYHLKIKQAEVLIAEKSFESALKIYEEVFSSYSFVFVRDYKIAAQLAWQVGDKSKACEFVKYGIAGGWKMKDIKKTKFLKSFRRTREFKTIKANYDSLHDAYLKRINPDLRWEVRKMSWKDQWKALMALFRFSGNAQAKYGEKKFAPKNALRLQRLLHIIENDGYPGERLIGDEAWMMGIIARRNQISQEFSKRDTIYQHLKPILFNAITKGEMSPVYYAFIDNWFITVESGRELRSYGFLDELSPEDLTRSNRLREKIGLRTVETHNKLIDIQERSGMWFYLEPKAESKVSVVE